MTANKLTIIDPKRAEIRRTHQENWEVMKPFVKFSFKAVKLIAITLVAIVKALPLLKPDHHTTDIKRR